MKNKLFIALLCSGLIAGCSTSPAKEHTYTATQSKVIKVYVYPHQGMVSDGNYVQIDRNSK